MEKKLTREQAEAKILDLFKRIHKVHKQYNPDGEYITGCVVDGHIMVFNSRNAEDKERPIDIFEEL